MGSGLMTISARFLPLFPTSIFLYGHIPGVSLGEMGFLSFSFFLEISPYFSPLPCSTPGQGELVWGKMEKVSFQSFKLTNFNCHSREHGSGMLAHRT
jgi:hypothetical protein